MDVGFRRIKWFRTKSAWQDMQDHRKRRAEAIARNNEMMAGISAAMASAQQNYISGMTNNAAQAALNRVQAQAQSKVAEMTKQIESAQSLVDNTQPTSSSGTATVLDTVA